MSWDICLITVYRLFSLRSSGAIWSSRCKIATVRSASWELMQIAAIQQAISAFEDVIADLDAEMEMEAAA